MFPSSCLTLVYCLCLSLRPFVLSLTLLFSPLSTSLFLPWGAADRPSHYPWSSWQHRCRELEGEVGGLNEGSDARREGWKEKRKRRKGDWMCGCIKRTLPFPYFLHLLCFFFHQPVDIFFVFLFQSSRSAHLPQILFSSISLRWRWLCLCICDIKSTAVPWLLARVNPAHSHLKIKWPYIYAAQIIGLSFGLAWWENGQEIDSHRFA